MYKETGFFLFFLVSKAEPGQPRICGHQKMSEAKLRLLYSNTSFDMVPELSQTHSADVQPVQKNLTLVQLHHAEQGQEERRLAGSCASDDAHLLPRSHDEAHPIQGVRKAIPVDQNHTAELQPALRGPGWVQLRVEKRTRRATMKTLPNCCFPLLSVSRL